ncbi:MAG: M6 family metalloprotease domain-containing protein [Candidatus Kapabacteria bacterium]|nr:M6 family metalloprotease domain-containing protein [Candidatus Kapabacteria bacterium]
MIFKYKLIFLLILFLSTTRLFSAYLEFVPQTVVQPDGSVLELFATGDEYYNWLHDKDGFTIMRNPEDGYLYYAEKVGDILVPGKLRPGKDNPAEAGLKPWLKFSYEYIKPRVDEFLEYRYKPIDDSKRDRVQTPKTGTINNIVIFIRFSDESEFTDQRSTYESMFNAESGNSMKNYFREASYNSLSIQTYFYPETNGSTVISYQATQPRNYYRPYDANTNPIGYQNSTQRRDREHTLLANAVNAIKSQIPTSLNIDGDNDGYVDNVCFIVSGTPDAWASLLWPHMWSLYSLTVTINEKRVYTYNFQIRSMTNNSVLCHEMFHSLGAPDLYHYTSNGISPVGPWDLMENNLSPPQHMCAYMKFRYAGWIASIPEITTSGYYTLSPLTSSTNNAYKIKSPVSTTEYFVVEYRRKTGTFENSLPGSGLIVYRINNSYSGQGNANGPPDEVYVYRPNGTTTNNGTVNSANFSSDVSRTQINNFTNPSAFLSNGSAGYLNISEIGSSGNTITFYVGFDTISVPVLISPADNSTNLGLRPTFTWNTFTGATSYEIQVSDVSSFSNLVINQTGLTGTSFTPSSDLSNNTRYYWRVRATTAQGQTGWSSVFSFTTTGTIIITAINGKLCAGNYIQIDFTAGITFNDGNVFRAYLSDSLGKFNNQIQIGSLTSTTSGTITALIPVNIASGSKYRIRIIASNPSTTGFDNGQDLVITAKLYPYISGKSVVCSGTIEPYFTTVENGIINTWKVIKGGELIGDTKSPNVQIKWDDTSRTGIIRLAKSSASGCTDTTILEVSINPVPNPTIIGDLAVCENSYFIYRSPIVAGNKNDWEVEGGKVHSILNQEMVKILWGSKGKGKLRLKQTINETGCFTLLERDITINEAPVATKISGEKSTCLNSENIYSVEKTTGKITKQWSIKGGTIKKQINSDSALVVWNQTGKGTVKVVFINQSGCMDSSEYEVVVNSIPDPFISGNARTCENSTETYTTYNDKNLTSEWRVVGGEIIGDSIGHQIEVKWITQGNGKVYVTQTNTTTNCKKIIFQDIDVASTPEKPIITVDDDRLKSSSPIGNQWYLDKQIIPDATEQYYEPKTNGLYSVRVKIGSCLSEFSEEFNVTFASVRNELIIDNFNISPNPTSGVINLVSNYQGEYLVEIYNLLGEKLGSKVISDEFAKIDLADYSSQEGLFIIRFYFPNNQIITKKVIRLLN